MCRVMSYEETYRGTLIEKRNGYLKYLLLLKKIVYFIKTFKMARYVVDK